MTSKSTPHQTAERSFARAIASRTAHKLALWGAALAVVPTLGLALGTEPAFATVVKIGNGDDGGDLEGGQKVSSGILIETRNKALTRLKNLNVQAVEHLGALIPELEKSDIYLVPRDLASKLNADAGMESSADGKSVYARTFAEPHAATRFFPAALMLNEEQLISLHVHEALHRSLPASVRENEAVVSKVTLAITGPDASLDRVRSVVRKETSGIDGVVPASVLAGANGQPVTVVINNNYGEGQLKSSTEIVNEPLLEKPSSLTYGFRSFMIPEKAKASYPVETMHSLQSFLYPFGNKSRAVGLGLEFSYLKTPDKSYLGPISLAARMRLASVGNFDLGLWGNIALNTTAADEIKNSPLGRDVTTIGLSARRDGRDFYIENLLSLSGEGEAQEKVGNITYTHKYGTATAVSVRAGGKISGFEMGGFAEVLLADFHRISGGAFKTDSGRFRIISAGPEAAYNTESLRFAVSARWVVDSTQGMSLDDVGDIMGRGVGEGFVGASASLRF